MNSVKKLEIVIDAAHTPALLRALRNANAPGYTVFRDVQGMGDRGERSGDELTDVFRNCYVLVACSPEESQRITEAIRPLLQKYGGICLVTDAESLQH